MNEIIAIFAGVGLAAACGFRVFVPLFIASLAANQGVDALGGMNFEEMLGANFEWLGNDWVTIALGVATALEIGSYYIPWLDNALDTIATPAAVVAGTFISGAMLPEFMGNDAFKWITAAIMGGGTAGIVQGASVITRGASTATTGGIGNPAVSTAELGGSILTAGLAVLIPILAAVLVLFLLFYFIRTIIRYFVRRLERKRAGQPSEVVTVRPPAPPGL
ncbi:DUF4126 domain-containing protein [Coraliomargarita sp. SDUM461004]|uniref:DUF4126 domain-containing protein n=1 Tax=Thalassobacterium sedimentorum TaxID=3041258 RepID=A0ABU1AM87_9BACT|nr:DUF4126 domain-containing protein [Coraliomargarita sp. SDUM461004]MDQ8195920.1 DUF4126 domain-containing protein [Coraliomargarita sp. SDUM461004]